MKHASLPAASEKAAAVDAMFDTIAPRYDRLNRILTLGLDVAWRRSAVRSSVATGARVLDIACGTGDFCREVSAAGGFRRLDRSAGMLTAAHTRAPDATRARRRLFYRCATHLRRLLWFRAAQRGALDHSSPNARVC